MAAGERLDAGSVARWLCLATVALVAEPCARAFERGARSTALHRRSVIAARIGHRGDDRAVPGGRLVEAPPVEDREGVLGRGLGGDPRAIVEMPAAPVTPSRQPAPRSSGGTISRTVSTTRNDCGFLPGHLGAQPDVPGTRITKPSLAHAARVVAAFGDDRRRVGGGVEGLRAVATLNPAATSASASGPPRSSLTARARAHAIPARVLALRGMDFLLGRGLVARDGFARHGDISEPKDRANKEIDDRRSGHRAQQP